MTGFVCIFSFASLVGVPWSIVSSVVKLRKKHNKKAFIFKLNSIETLIQKALIYSYISHDVLTSINIVLKEILIINRYVWCN